MSHYDPSGEKFTGSAIVWVVAFVAFIAALVIVVCYRAFV